MMKKSAPSHAISGVFVFLLLGIFAVFSTVMALLGAKAYQATANRVENHNANRIAAAYLRSMVRSDDETGAIALEEIAGVKAVSLKYTYDDEDFVTRLYVYDGMLREWFTSADMEFEPELGEAVCPADEMAAERNGQLLTVRLRHGDEWEQVDIALRSQAN